MDKAVAAKVCNKIAATPQHGTEYMGEGWGWGRGEGGGGDGGGREVWAAGEGDQQSRLINILSQHSVHGDERHIHWIDYICKYSFSTFNVQSKVNEAKQSEKFDAKISEYWEKREAKNWKRTSKMHAKRISVRFVSLWSEKKYKQNRCTLVQITWEKDCALPVNSQTNGQKGIHINVRTTHAFPSTTLNFVALCCMCQITDLNVCTLYSQSTTPLKQDWPLSLHRYNA
jgi:hypothetical protein